MAKTSSPPPPSAPPSTRMLSRSISFHFKRDGRAFFPLCLRAVDVGDLTGQFLLVLLLHAPLLSGTLQIRPREGEEPHEYSFPIPPNCSPPFSPQVVLDNEDKEDSDLSDDDSVPTLNLSSGGNTSLLIKHRPANSAQSWKRPAIPCWEFGGLHQAQDGLCAESKVAKDSAQLVDGQ
ncbi:hypothetical protein Aperf_G00000088029 [Anoplocephala perfoliata]